MLRTPILVAARNKRIERLVSRAPVTRSVVDRFVGGSTTEQAVESCRGLIGDGLTATLDFLGEDTTDRAQADATVAAYVEALAALQAAGLTGTVDGRPAARAEVSVKLSAVGQALGSDGEAIALDNARRIAEHARDAGASMTVDMEDHTTTDSTLSIVRGLRADFPDTGAVVQAYLKRTEADCRELATAGSRIRLCKGAYNEPPSVAFTDRDEVDASYRRCLEVLLDGEGLPMIATHDPKLISFAQEELARRHRTPADHEFQMLFGIRPAEQKRLAAGGHTVRVYVPYGSQWYGYLMRRLAERPANLTFFARALMGTK